MTKLPEGKVIDTFKILGCKGVVIEDAEGVQHVETTCRNKEQRDVIAALFEQEITLRVNPKVVFDDEPQPDTRLNPTES